MSRDVYDELATEVALADDLAAIVAVAIDWFEWEAAHAPDGGPHDPRDLRLYQLLADPAVRAVLARYREARR